jgi:hypothetical protein
MSIEMYSLECQHPFGPHIHIVMPDNQPLLWALIDGFGIRETIEHDLLMLKKLATPTRVADKCTAYQLDEDAWAIVALRARTNDKHAIRVLFVRIDPEGKFSSKEVAETIRVELGKAMVRYGEK